jgi:hypothetical protein
MPLVGSAGRVTAVVKGHYPKKVISISRQDCVAGARTCTPSLSNSSTDHGERDAVSAPFRSDNFCCQARVITPDGGAAVEARKHRLS